jgi:hypothetical protein
MLHALAHAVLRDDLRERRVPYSRRGFPVGREAVRVEAERDVLVSMAVSSGATSQANRERHLSGLEPPGSILQHRFAEFHVSAAVTPGREHPVGPRSPRGRESAARVCFPTVCLVRPARKVSSPLHFQLFAMTGWFRNQQVAGSSPAGGSSFNGKFSLSLQGFQNLVVQLCGSRSHQVRLPDHIVIAVE